MEEMSASLHHTKNNQVIYVCMCAGMILPFAIQPRDYHAMLKQNALSCHKYHLQSETSTLI